MRSLQPALADLLAYLGEIGYPDIYPNPPGAVRAQPTAVLAPMAEPAGDRISGTAELAAFAATVEVCTRCRLAQGRQKVVFGAGNPSADLMLIGDAPDAEEDREGLPLVGAAGELLTKIIQAIDMRRDNIYVTNVIKCRPPGDREPQMDEAAACRGHLERQIDLIQPKVIVVLGRTAAQILLGKDSPIGQMRGQWYRVKGIPAMVTYHPAALLKNQALKRPTWEDMQQVRDRLRA